MGCLNTWVTSASAGHSPSILGRYVPFGSSPTTLFGYGATSAGIFGRDQFLRFGSDIEQRVGVVIE
jgi:hypothetical protein